MSSTSIPVSTCDADSIERVLAKHEAAWNEGNLEGLLDGYIQTTDLRYASGDQVIRGYQAVRERFLTQYPNREAMGRLSFSSIEESRLTENDAIAFGRWRIERDAGALTGLFTLQLRRQDGEWRIATDHTSVGQ